MNSKLDLIIFQNWLLLLILLVLLIGNFICNWKQFQRNNTYSEGNEDRLSDLWDSGKVDEVLKQTEVILAELPNRVDALYFRGKAMLNNNNYEEAKVLFQRLALADITLSEAAKSYLKEIELKTTNKTRNEMDGSHEPPIR